MKDANVEWLIGEIKKEVKSYGKCVMSLWLTDEQYDRFAEEFNMVYQPAFKQYTFTEKNEK